MSVLEAFKLDNYRIGPLQAIEYDRRRVDFFPPGYLGDIFFRLRGNLFNSRDGTGVLQALFCGLSDVSYDNIVSYFAQRPLLIIGEWVQHDDSDEHFEPAAIAFPVSVLGTKETERAVIMGYALFRPYWGHEYSEVIGMLGLAYFFQEMNLLAVHGVRYDTNVLTARFCAKYGAKEHPPMERFQVRDGKLVSAIPTTILREDFENCQLVQEYLQLRAEPQP